LDLGLVVGGADVGIFRLQQWSLPGHFDGLGNVADNQLDVGGGNLPQPLAGEQTFKVTSLLGHAYVLVGIMMDNN